MSNLKLLWKSRSRSLLAPRLAPHRCHTRLILLPDFLPCLPSFLLVTCHRHSSYLVPCATSTRHRAISHRRDSPSATLSSALYIQPMYLLYLVRFELVGLYTACTSHIPSSLRAILHYCASVPWCCDTNDPSGPQMKVFQANQSVLAKESGLYLVSLHGIIGIASLDPPQDLCATVKFMRVRRNSIMTSL